jgi:hypothetical protein
VVKSALAHQKTLGTLTSMGFEFAFVKNCICGFRKFASGNAKIDAAVNAANADDKPNALRIDILLPSLEYIVIYVIE